MIWNIKRSASYKSVFLKVDIDFAALISSVHSLGALTAKVKLD